MMSKNPSIKSEKMIPSSSTTYIGVKCETYKSNDYLVSPFYKPISKIIFLNNAPVEKK